METLAGLFQRGRTNFNLLEKRIVYNLMASFEIHFKCVHITANLSLEWVIASHTNQEDFQK